MSDAHIILIADSSPDICALLVDLLTEEGYVPLKGFHLTNGRLADAAKRALRACQDVVSLVLPPDANAVRASASDSIRVRGFHHPRCGHTDALPRTLAACQVGDTL